MADLVHTADTQIPETLRKCSFETGTDSGLDNASDSGTSYEDGRMFSSTESLDDAEASTVVIREKCKDFIEYEKRCTVIAFDPPEDLQDEVPTVSPISETSDKNTTHPTCPNFHMLPPYFQELWLSKGISANFDVNLDTKPPWYDDEKFKRGQKFAQSHLFCINYAETLSLFLIFSLESALQPLIFSGKSGTPYKAFERYLSTLTRIMSWYQNDIWDDTCQARRHLITVRAMHRSVQQRLSAASPSELRQRSKVGGGGEAVWSTSRQFVQDDFRAGCPMPALGTCPVSSSSVWVNQYDMAITQFAFVGMVVTYPQQFGIHHATEDDLEGFIHLWRTLGYLLGIQDKYNYCNLDLEGVRQRTNDFISLSLKPSLRNVTIEWEHMSRCLVQGIAFYVPLFTFDVSLKYLCNIIQIHTPRLDRSFNIWQSFMVGLVSFTFNVICRLPGALSFYNKMMMKAIQKAQDAPPKLLKKWEDTVFPYMTAPVKDV